MPASLHQAGIKPAVQRSMFWHDRPLELRLTVAQIWHRRVPQRHKFASILMRARKFYKFIIITIIIPVSHYSAIRRERLRSLLEDLRTVVEFAHVSSIASAADRLFRAPAAITRQVQRLEAAQMLPPFGRQTASRARKPGSSRKSQRRQLPWHRGRYKPSPM